MIALPTSEATRLDVDYKKGQMTLGSTAKGAAPADRDKLNTVGLGDIDINQVDALM